MEVKGFCERAWVVEGRNWKGKPLYKALIDGHEVDFFIDSKILEYQNKEITYDQTEGEYGKKGKLQGSEKKPFQGGYQGKPRSSDAAFAMSYAKDLVVASIGPKPLAVDACTLTCNWAKEIYKCMKEIEKGE